MLAQTGFYRRKILDVFKLLLALSFLFSSLLKATDNHPSNPSKSTVVSSSGEGPSAGESRFRRLAQGVGSFFGRGFCFAVGAPALVINPFVMPFCSSNIEISEEVSLASATISLAVGSYFYPRLGLAYVFSCSVIGEFLEERDRRKLSRL